MLAALGIETPPSDDVRELVNVRSREEIKAADEIAERSPCHDFAQFQPIFEKIQSELKSGRRRTVKYGDRAAIEKGDLFILDGQKVLVAEAGEEFVSDYGRPDRRLRVVYDNGTESDLLLRSLQRALYKDQNSRRITRADFGLLFSDDEEEGDLATGHIYVLRSKSEHPFVAEHREVLHKIGVTGGDVKSRVAGAKKAPTYLLADVELVATYKLANVGATSPLRLESKPGMKRRSNTDSPIPCSIRYAVHPWPFIHRGPRILQGVVCHARSVDARNPLTMLEGTTKAKTGQRISSCSTAFISGLRGIVRPLLPTRSARTLRAISQYRSPE